MSKELTSGYGVDGNLDAYKIVMTPQRPVLNHTWYGFEWLPEHSTAEILVERTATIKGSAIMRVSTGHDEIEIYVSKGGRSIRVWRTKTGKEMKDPIDE